MSYDIIIAALFGLIFGSFLNVVIIRIPKEESIVFGGSHCVHCNTPLKPWHNIPLFSWLFLGGKCSFCHTKISLQYPLIEFFSAVIATLVVMKYGLSLSALFTTLSFFMLLALAVIDFRYKMVPDSLNLLAIFFALLGSFNIYGFLFNLQNALLFTGGFTLLRFSLSYYLTSSLYRVGLKTKTSWNKHYDRTPFIEAMGEGDIMVAATMGALLGVKLALFGIFLSAILALPVMLLMLNRSAEEQRVPFVPFLVMATLLCIIFDNQIISYLNTLG